MSACAVRPAMRADAEAINAIQNYYVVNSTATFLTEPLTLEQRHAWLEGRSRQHPVSVAVDQGVVVGWGHWASSAAGRPTATASSSRSTSTTTATGAASAARCWRTWSSAPAPPAITR